MKKLIISLFALLLISAGAFATTTNQSCDTKGKITTEASESKDIAPDTATISFTVETFDKNSQKSVELNNQKASALVSAIKNSLNPNETIKTSSYTLRQKYEYSNITKKNVMTGYIVTNTVTVVLKDTKKTGKIIDLATKNGATSVNSLSFYVQSSDNVCQELTTKATAKAKKQAAAILVPLGKTIDSVESINYSCSTQNSFPNYRNYAFAKTMGSSDEMATPAPIEQGETKVTATVKIIFRIK